MNCQNLYFNTWALVGFAIFIYKLLDVVADPVAEGRDSSEHWRFLVSDAALRSKADDTMHLPGRVCSRSRAGKRTSRVTLRGEHERTVTKDLLYR